MIKRISTGDGSDSLYVEELNETYHSKHGALRESKHVFIQQGLDYSAQKNQTIKVLEVGMGTGLNVLLACVYALQRKVNVELTTLEPFPIDDQLLQSMNYSDLMDASEANGWFEKIHSSSWKEGHTLHEWFKFSKFNVQLENFESHQKFDLVFYDAFGPHAQPELWETPVFQKLTNFLDKGAVLVTYCAQGQFKRNLKSTGFSIERLPGPPGKREMTRARYLG